MFSHVMLGADDIDAAKRDQAAGLASRFNPRLVSDYRNIVDLKDVDAVIIATPNFVHRPIALAAIALLVVFTGFIALELSHGRRPTCACFGSRSSARLGPGHLARNAIFIALGVLAAIG